jgi:hypothetical protein
MTGVSFSETEWRQFLKPERPRPNLLVLCTREDIELVVTRMMAVCSGPVYACGQTGELSLPEETNGTLLLWDVARLTFSEQMKLQDWIAAHSATAQVISITSSPLLPLVEDGQFLEGLFYRINVVSLVAKIGGDSGDAHADTHSQMEQRRVARGLTLQ